MSPQNFQLFTIRRVLQPFWDAQGKEPNQNLHLNVI